MTKRRATLDQRLVVDKDSPVLEEDPSVLEAPVLAMTAPVPCQTPATDRVLTRKPAAQKLGMSVSTFRRTIEHVKIIPLKKGGIHFFHETAILALAAERAGKLAPSPAEERGKIAARVFDLFDKQTHAVDVVKQLELDPQLVEQLHDRWLRMRRVFSLTAEQADLVDATMREWASDRSMIPTKPIRVEPVRSGEQLVIRLQELRAHFTSATAPCAKCKRAPRRVCVECYRRLSDTEKTRRVQIVEDAKTMRAQYAADSVKVKTRLRGGRGSGGGQQAVAPTPTPQAKGGDDDPYDYPDETPDPLSARPSRRKDLPPVPNYWISDAFVPEDDLIEEGPSPPVQKKIRNAVPAEWLANDFKTLDELEDERAKTARPLAPEQDSKPED